MAGSEPTETAVEGPPDGQTPQVEELTEQEAPRVENPNRQPEGEGTQPEQEEKSEDPYTNLRKEVSSLYRETKTDLERAQQKVSEKRKNLFERLIKTPGKKLLTAGTALTIGSILWQTSPVEIVTEAVKVASPIIHPLLELGKIPIEKMGRMLDKLKVSGIFGLTDSSRAFNAHKPHIGPIQKGIFAFTRLFYNPEQSVNISAKITKFLATPFITVFGKNSLLINPATNALYFAGITPITPILFPLIGALGVYKAFKILKRKYIEYSPTAQIREREREQLLDQLKKAEKEKDYERVNKIQRALNNLDERLEALEKITERQETDLTERQRALLGYSYSEISAIG